MNKRGHIVTGDLGDDNEVECETARGYRGTKHIKPS